MSGISIRLRDVSFTYGRRSITARDAPPPVVRDVSLALKRGETLGLVGESGSGKSTLARIAGGLLRPQTGEVEFNGMPLQTNRRVDTQTRRKIQFVFQDPIEAFDPKLTIGAAIEEAVLGRFPWKASAPDGTVRRRVIELSEWVQLDARLLESTPRRLSGGQLQRAGIARALATDPEVVILDEPTSALDVSIRGEMLGLLERLRKEAGLTYLLISHDFFAIAGISSTIAVMYAGEIVEHGPAEDLLFAPSHPYTHALMAAMPGQGADRERERLLTGELVQEKSLLVGCSLVERCPARQETCRSTKPDLIEVGALRSRCHFAGAEPPAPSVRRTFTRAQALVQAINGTPRVTPEN
jgi:peptide/nickel transport system ATP-binding protein